MSQPKTYLYSHDGKDYANDKWDYGLLKEIFDKNDIEQTQVTELPIVDKGFVVIPGAQSIDQEKNINKELQNIKKVVLFITGDEEAKFNINAIDHKNIDIWIQYPHENHDKYYKLPIGVPQHLKQNIPQYSTKKYDVYFGGQITHIRRQQLAKVMQELPNALYKPTEGFARGDKPRDYYQYLASSKICPAPAGVEVIDSFRFFEALEMMSLPVGDLKNSKNIEVDFYKKLFETKIPIELVSNWDDLKKILPDLLSNYPHNMHKAVSWWIKYKRDLSNIIMGQINAKK